MATIRKIVFANEEYYHVFNRGVDRRITFSNKREFERAKNLLYFYQFSTIPLRFSQFSRSSDEIMSNHMDTMLKSGKIVEVISYCLMPNHFHLLLKQNKDMGISTYISNFVNAYTKYFNTKNDRVGHLFQGVFKAVYVETDEQLLHLTRYIHLNPIVASLVTENTLVNYHWSSYPSYISQASDELVEKESIGNILKQIPNYKEFLSEQISYAKKLDAIKHLVLE